MNIELIILPKEIEDAHETRTTLLNATASLIPDQEITTLCENHRPFALLQEAAYHAFGSCRSAKEAPP